MPLVATALIDELLRETLQAFLCECSSSAKLIANGNAALATFSSRAEACRALALIDDFEYSEINLLRKIRNEFAHARHGISFTQSKVRGLCSSLESPIPDEPGWPVNDARFRFTNASLHIVLRLYPRKDWALLAKRKVKDWGADNYRFPPSAGDATDVTDAAD
ncbi:hypothetical protein K9B32_10215 [Rhizobium sp. 3T7]|uniref:hypothetical protein n=1 Tax=Rhizobium sp. 3T7 TaxID=2874922 RepID=UPI001CCEE38B|nr:hypothetical protein [Rhizobium sp. 3T7]MBZ9790494.1 hypothetical protein [Rhizobium sp. 3T7]